MRSFSPGLLFAGIVLLPWTAYGQAPSLEIVQTLKAGEDGLPKPFITAYTIVVHGKFVYVGGNNISCFQRDDKGQLTFLGEVADVMARVADAFPKSRKWNTSRKTCIIKQVGNRLYAIPQAGTAMAWYDIDEQTGKLTEKGLVECPPCFHAVVSPDQKDMYLMTNPYARGPVKMGLTWYHLEADGKPVKSGEVFGMGLGGSDQTPYEGVLQMSPDGKFIYAISGNERAIACIERKPSGEISFKNATDLDKTAPRAGKYPWAATMISGDGKWLYGQLWAYGKQHENCFGIFKRDLDSGALTLQEVVTGDKNPLANRRGWQQWHFPTKGTGYFGHYDLGLWTFQYDPQTGQLGSPVQIKESQGYRASIAYDFERGLLYMGGVWIVEGGIKDGFRVLKLPAK